jgi:hypothetical protein
LQAHLGGKSYGDAHNGKVGIALNIEYLAPLTNSSVDVAAANYGLEKNLGWFADPIFFGMCCRQCLAKAAILLMQICSKQCRVCTWLGAACAMAAAAAAAAQGSVLQSSTSSLPISALIEMPPATPSVEGAMAIRVTSSTAQHLLLIPALC